MVGGGKDEERFRDFVVRCSPALLRTAYLLTGDRGHAEDLLQTALLKTYRHWHRLRNKDDPAAFVRRVMATTQAMSWRQRRVDERVAEALPEPATTQHGQEAADDTMWLALAELPPRMRAVA